VSGRRTARDRGLSLRRAAALFVAERPPKLVLLGLAIAVGTRLAWGQWTLWDALPAVLLPLAHPFIEWLIHVFILHHRPRRVAGIPIDFHAAKHHRAHHRDPWDLRFVVIPLPALINGALIATAIWWWTMPTVGAFLTAVCITAFIALCYEWVHFLTHTSYRPQGAFYRQLWRFHRLHHYKNEHYWFGVTRHFGDRVLKTLPDPDSVETSPTCRNLDAEQTLGD
jgi:sterol desaturase/sphingolipid hydroxylase (fatty acid hydroxylase superfamily)